MRFSNIRFILITVTLLLAQSVFAISFPNLMETTETSGINHSYTGGWEYFVGGGVAAFDCNQDRKPELFFAGGEGSSALYLNTSETAGAIRFLRAEKQPVGHGCGYWRLPSGYRQRRLARPGCIAVGREPRVSRHR